LHQRLWRTDFVRIIVVDVEVRRGTYLQRKDTHTASPLHKNRLARLQRLQSIQRIPARQPGAGQCARLEEVEVARGADDAILVEDTVLAEGAIDNTTEPGVRRCSIDGPELMQLVEYSNDLVSLLELIYLRSDLDDLAGSVGSGDDGEVEWEGVFALDNSSVRDCSRKLEGSLGRRGTLGMIRSR
jgi:hypothetical protein